jgi:hypothetical protein
MPKKLPKPHTAIKAKAKGYSLPTIDSDEPSWKLEEGLSFSGFDMWLRCKEQFRLSYIQGWRPIEDVDGSLLFGSMMHKLIEDRPGYEPSNREKGTILQSWEDDDFKRGLLASLQKVKGVLGDRPVIEARAAAVYRVYAHHHKIHNERRIDGGAEKRFHYEYKFKHGGKSYIIPLMGYIDCVYQVDKNNIGIRETKTRRAMDLDNTTVALVADLQVNSYFLACEQYLGKFPTELQYDLVKNPQHEPLAANTKRPNTESLPDYHSRVFDAVSAEPSNYLQRIPYKRSLAEFNNWRNGILHPHLAEFYNWYQRVKDNGYRSIDPYNPTALVGKYGLSRLFHLVVSGDTRGLTKRTKRREETRTEETKQAVNGRIPAGRSNRTK